MKRVEIAVVFTTQVQVAWALLMMHVVGSTPILADSVSYIRGDQIPALEIVPLHPLSSEIVEFTIPLDGIVHANECEMRAELGGSAVLVRNDAARLITLSTDGIFAPFCTRIFDPHAGAIGQIGPLRAGDWLLRDDHGNELSFQVGLACDLDGDGDCDYLDIDLLYAVDGDIETWLSQASDVSNPAKADPADQYILGDVNLDGDVDSMDLGILLNNLNSTRVEASTWFGGDLNDTGDVDSTDLGLLLNNFRFTSFANAVPEPDAFSLLSIGVIAILRIRRKRNRVPRR